MAWAVSILYRSLLSVVHVHKKDAVSLLAADGGVCRHHMKADDTYPHACPVQQAASCRV